MKLKQIMHGHANALLSRNTTKAILSDALNNDIPKVNALMSAYDTGIVELILENYPVDNLVRNNAINKLVRQHSMLNDTAMWAVNQWVQLIDETMVREILEEQNAKEKEREQKLFGEDGMFGNELLDFQDTSSAKAMDLFSREDRVDYYTNVRLQKIKGRIYVPCGVGNTDNGFYIFGIEEKACSSAPTVYALVYNYLTRNSCITQEDYPHYFVSVKTTYQMNYQRVFRLMIIILQLIKNEMVSYKLNLRYTGNDEELDMAVAIINDYVARFSRIMRVKKIILERVTANKNAINLSLDKQNNGVYIEENRVPCNARELWYGEKINYQLDIDLIPDLEYILGEISPFDTFKEGQFAALKNMMGTRGHSICIMPTGSGKSLIFYFASLLQPLPMFILAPTEILIDDQIRNLKKIHHMDNVSHLMLTADNDFSRFEIRNSMLYLTPTTFQNRYLFVHCRHFNSGHAFVKNEKSRMMEDIKVAPGPCISYVVLDEIHCLSNWGHDFRPEYLMLSKFLNKFLDRVTFLGFTATANYTVVEDIQQQLSILQHNIFSPISFDKYNVKYHFVATCNFDEMLQEVSDIVHNHIQRNERTIVFTKNDEISCQVAQAIGYEADVFQKDNTFAYHLFADEKCKVLVASEELGIGINLPNIQNIIHFGLPVSKNEFVQEIGRAGRSNESVNSYVLYLKPTPENMPEVLLKRELETPNLSSILNESDNDYSDCYRKICSNIDSKEELLSRILDIYTELKDNKQGLYVKEYPLASVEMTKKYIFMLYAIGYINDWYTYSGNEHNGVIKIMIDVSNTNHDYYQVPANMLKRVQQRALGYYETLGSNREQIVRTQRAKDLPEVIKVYVEWYYAKFIYHHKEMFLDFLDFVETNGDNDSEKITDDISEYFALPFIEIKTDEVYYSKLSLEEVADKVSQGIGRNTLANVERINSNRYMYTMDCFLFLGNLKLYTRFDKSRFERIISNTPAMGEQELVNAIGKVFAKLNATGRFEIIRGLANSNSFLGNDLSHICDVLYQNTDKDTVYYGVMAYRLNGRFIR